MRILVLGINYAPEKIGTAVYTEGLCRRLTALGHRVRVVTAKPYYPDWKVPPAYRGGWTRADQDGVDVTRCPLYVPANPRGLKRLVHYASFALASLFPVLAAARSFRPDLILSIAPSLVSAPVALLGARLCRAKSWLHIQDFEVEAAFAVGLLDPIKASARVARKLERGIVGAFDHVSSISPEMCAKLLQFGIPAHRIHEIRNWANNDQVRPLSGPSRLRAEWDIQQPHVALYSGSIAHKQGLEIILEAAERLAHRDDLLFLVCGEGPNRSAMEQQAEAINLRNIRFMDLQPLGVLSDLLGLATVHLLPQKAEAADLVLPSKLTNMLASGRPVVATAHQGTGLAREVEGCGLVIEPGDAPALAHAIERLIDDPPAREAFSAAARHRAESVWNPAAVVAKAAMLFERAIRA